MKMIRSPRARAIPALRPRARPALAWWMTVKAQVARRSAAAITSAVESFDDAAAARAALGPNDRWKPRAAHLIDDCQSCHDVYAN